MKIRLWLTWSILQGGWVLSQIVFNPEKINLILFWIAFIIWTTIAVVSGFRLWKDSKKGEVNG